MTTLADLIALGQKAESFGFKPEEVQVEFKVGTNTVSLLDAKACVSATENKAKPLLTINFTAPQSGYHYR